MFTSPFVYPITIILMLLEIRACKPKQKLYNVFTTKLPNNMLHISIVSSKKRICFKKKHLYHYFKPFLSLQKRIRLFIAPPRQPLRSRQCICRSTTTEPRPRPHRRRRRDIPITARAEQARLRHSGVDTVSAHIPYFFGRVRRVRGLAGGVLRGGGGAGGVDDVEGRYRCGGRQDV